MSTAKTPREIAVTHLEQAENQVAGALLQLRKHCADSARKNAVDERLTALRESVSGAKWDLRRTWR